MAISVSQRLHFAGHDADEKLADIIALWFSPHVVNAPQGTRCA